MTLRSLRFPLVVGGIVAAFSVLVSVLLVSGTPDRMRWLGDTVQNSSDTAVYLSYLTQGADGAFLFKNLYAVEPSVARFDLIWSVLGLFARAGVPPLVAYELARILGGLILVFVIYRVARSMTKNEADARLATILTILGIGTGWVVSFTNSTVLVPDLVTEFAVLPALFGSFHILISMSLLLLGLRTFWMACEKRDLHLTVLSAATFGLLFLFHPYFVCVVAPFAAITIVSTRAMTHPAFQLRLIAICIAASVPTFFVYLPLVQDTTFVTHYTETTTLALSSPAIWIIALLPALIALGWRFAKNIRIQKDERWILAWMAAVLIAICLPLPFKRKFTEGLNIGIVFLTLPAWCALRKAVSHTSPSLRRMWFGLLLFAAGLSGLHLFMTQLVWVSSPKLAGIFYETTDVFSVWEWLHDHTDSRSVIIADDMHVNVWTPAYTGRRIWLGHPHETPDTLSKRAAWDTLLATENPLEARDLLAKYGTTHVLVTSAASHDRFQRLLGPEWTPVFSRGDVSVFSR